MQMIIWGKGVVGCVSVEEKAGQQQKVVHSWCPMTSGRLEEQTFVHFPELQFHPVTDNRCIFQVGSNDLGKVREGHVALGASRSCYMTFSNFPRAQ